MRGALVAPPSANLAPAATVSWSVGTADSTYPVANVKTLDPSLVAKTVSAGSATLTAALGGGATALEGVVLINTNLRGRTLTLTNGAGLSVARVVPSPEDGLGVNVYWDLRGVSSASASWSIAITGATAPIAIGTLVLVSAWTLLRVRWEWELGDVFPVIEHRSSYGARFQYQIPVRTRTYTALAFDAAQRNLVRQIAREAHGSIVPFPLVPDYEDDAVLLVQFIPAEHPETHRFGRGRFDNGTATGIVDRRLELEEVNAGVAL
jgi:hypothetical protein